MTDIRFGAATDTGRVRKINEDSMLHSPPLFVIADGMGGHSAGDVASKIAVDTLAEQVDDATDSLSKAVRTANRVIFEQSKIKPGQSGMGTTLTAMMAGPTSAQIVHVGDSRAYLLRAGTMTRLTQDHTVVARLVAQGKISPDEADHHPRRSWLERALGNAQEVDLDVHIFDTEPKDRILLCSDGLYGMLDEVTIQQVLDSEAEPDAASRRLCDEAVAAGGHDNVTVIVIDYPPGPTSSTGPTDNSSKMSASPASKALAKPKRPLRTVAIAAVLVLAAILVARSAIKSQWYVGEAAGKVTIFNGVKGSVAGFDLSEVFESSDLLVTELPNLYRDRLKVGMDAESADDARQTVADLKRIAATAPTTGVQP
ncbi:MAG: Stp1/IreP family PP2C-type Ser/Thr phosphatase [Actinomycetota bacterium]